MRILYPIAIFILVTTTASAQITVTNSTFYNTGDILQTATDDSSTTVVVTPPTSTAQTWDFSGLINSDANADLIEAASTGSAASDFPTADIRIPFIPGAEGYAEVTSTEIQIIGGSFDFNGFPIIAPLNNPRIVRRAPLNFGDLRTESSDLLTSFSTGSVPGLQNFLDSLSPLPIDSLKLIYNSDVNLEVDAFGSCTIPIGTYDVLRVKEREIRFSSIEAFIVLPFGGAWQDITSLLPGFGLGTDTITTYSFLSDNSKEAIAIINVDTDGSILETTFKNDSILAVQQPELKYALNLYPNPAIDVVRIESEIPAHINTSVELFNATGSMVKAEFVRTASAFEMDVQHLPAGVYFCRIINDQGELLAVEQLIKH